MAKKRVEKFRPAKSYDDAFEAFNDINNNVPTYGFASTGNQAASTFRGFDTGFGKSSYDENLSWNADIDENNVQGSINEYRSNQQGGLDETGAFFGRVGLKVGTEIAKTGAAIVGTVGGLAGNAIDLATGEDNHDFLEIAFNNDFIKAAEKIQKYVQDEYLPVYVSDTVTNGGFLDKVTAGEFWATEGADGVGYLISAMAPGAAFKALGGANKIFGGITKATALRYGKSIEVARKSLTNAGMTTGKIDSYMIPAFNTYFEAGAEAKGAGDSMDSRKPEFIEKYKSELDINSKEFQIKALEKGEEFDEQFRKGEISIDEYNQLGQQLSEIIANELAESAFLEQKGRAMRNTFLTNVGILAVPNYIQAKLVFGKNPSKVLIDKITGKATEATVKNTVKQGLKRTGQAFLSEGSEEVGQTSTEHRNVERGLNNELSEYAIQDLNPVSFGEDFIKSLGTTEGQVAGFLGGILGSPISIVQGYRQDKADRKNTGRLREKINGQSTVLNDIYNTPIYEQEEYTNPETGETIIRDKEVDGEKVMIPENVAKIKKALDLSEQLSTIYDEAVNSGDIETLEALKKQGEFNIITNFIGEDIVTLDALNEHLNTIFPTIEKNEDGSDLTQEQIAQNKSNKERISSVISKAKSLQKDLVSFKDMTASIIRLNNKEASPKQIEDFLNDLGNAFLSERAEEYDTKEKLDKLEKARNEILKDIQLKTPGFFDSDYKTSEEIAKIKELKEANKQNKEIDVDENGFAFLTGNEIYQNNPRLNYLNEQIKKQKDKLKDFNETTNDLIWNNEFLNKQLNSKIAEENKLKEDVSPENIAKNNEVISKIDNATTKEEVENVEKNTKNPIIKEKAEIKKAEIVTAEEAINNQEREDAVQEDSDFNNVTTYDGLTATEGSIITDELIPQEAENNTTEELKSIGNSEVDNGLGVKVISTDRSTGLPLQFMTEQFPLYLDYEREPVNKSGKEVGFEINQTPGKNPKALEALNAFNNKDFSNPKLLIDFLPLNVLFTNEVKAPIETRRVTNDINIATSILRTEIINHLIKGGSINDIKTTIQDQYKGLLKVDENRFANNNILQLDGVKDLNYIRENLYVVNSFGKLQNILNDKTFEFNNDKIKPNAAGEIYLTIPQANGKPFPLKLNIKKISESEAVLLYEIYKEIITNKKSLDTTVSEVNGDLQEAILKSFEAELNIIGGNKNDIKLQEIVDLLIYQSANVKSQMQVVNGILYFGDKESTIDTIEQDQNNIINFLVNSKRHQIKINMKSETDNIKTNLKSNSADYLKYLIDNNILSTNAVVNEPTFQGYTNIYLNTGITVNNQTKSEIEVQKAEIERRRQEELGSIPNPKNFNSYIAQNYQGFDEPLDIFLKREFPQFEELIPIIKQYKISKGTTDSKRAYAEAGYSTSVGNVTGNIKSTALSLRISDLHTESNREEKINTIAHELIHNLIAISTRTKNKEVRSKFDKNLKNLSNEIIEQYNKEKENFLSKEEIKRADQIFNRIIKQENEELLTYGLTDKETISILKRLKDESKLKENLWTRLSNLISNFIGLTNNKFNRLIEFLNDENIITDTYENTISNINAKYDVELAALNQPKISESDVEATNSNSEGLDFGNNVINEDDIDNLPFGGIPEELQKRIENNQQNNRNSQENFVSLSEIPGTVENTEIKETQGKVFNTKRTPKEKALDFRRMNALFKRKNEKGLTTEKELRDFEMFKQMYPQEFEKRCN